MTMPGAPRIYYGDEAGMWSGVKYDTEIADPLGRERKPDVVVFNGDLFNWYKKLIDMRRDNKVLSEGELNFFYINNGSKILGYRRTLYSKTVFVILNNDNANKSLEMKLESPDNKGNVLTNLIDGKQVTGKDNNYKIDLPSYHIIILR